MKTQVIIWSSHHDDPDDDNDPNDDEDPDDGDLDDEDTNDGDGDNAGQSELLARGSHLLQPARPSWLQKEGDYPCDADDDDDDVYGVDHAEDDKVDQGDADDYSANDDDHTLAGEVHIMMICCWSCCCWWWWCPLPMIIMVVLQELLQEKLTIAISNAEGFGLE